jgi:hypothetical protein
MSRMSRPRLSRLSRPSGLSRLSPGLRTRPLRIRAAQRS